MPPTKTSTARDLVRDICFPCLVLFFLGGGPRPSSRQVRIRAPFFLLFILVGEPNLPPNKGEEGTTGGPSFYQIVTGNTWRLALRCCWSLSSWTCGSQMASMLFCRFLSNATTWGLTGSYCICLPGFLVCCHGFLFWVLQCRGENKGIDLFL